jgi:hypothetical protein
MWGSDYLHSESTFPQSRKILAEILTDVALEESARRSSGPTRRGSTSSTWRASPAPRSPGPPRLPAAASPSPSRGGQVGREPPAIPPGVRCTRRGGWSSGPRHRRRLARSGRARSRGTGAGARGSPCQASLVCRSETSAAPSGRTSGARNGRGRPGSKSGGPRRKRRCPRRPSLGPARSAGQWPRASSRWLGSSGVRRRAGTADGVRRGAESPRSDRGEGARCPVGVGCSAPELDVGARRCSRPCRPQEPVEVPLVQDEEVVEALSSDRADDPLGEGILPGRAGGR